MANSETAYVEVCHADIHIDSSTGFTQPLMPMLRVRTSADGPSDRWRPTLLPLREVAGLVDLNRIVWGQYDPLSLARMTSVRHRMAMHDLLARLEPATADEDDEPSFFPVTGEVAADLPPPPDLAARVAAALLIAAPAAPPCPLARITVEASTS